MILEFCKKHPAVYYLGKQTSRSYAIADFLKTAAQALQVPLLAELQTDNWKNAIQWLFEYGRISKNKKLVLVLDEFQWIVESSPELPSILQEFWDLDWQHSNQVLLILCGSYIGFMEREVLGKESPLFGRRTGQILLKPFSYQEARSYVLC